MVFLFNKAKIFSYIVAVTTVVLLFIVAANFNAENVSIQASTTQIKNGTENIVNTVNWIKCFK